MIRVENQLRESEENYRLLVEHQNDLVVKFDEHNRLLYVNPNYCRTCGLDEQDILGKVFLPLIHEDDIETVKASIDSLNIPPHTSYHEERAKTVDGWRWFGWSLKGLVEEVVRNAHKRLEVAVAGGGLGTGNVFICGDP